VNKVLYVAERTPQNI